SPAAAPTAPPAQGAAAPAGGSGVHEGDLVEFSQLDSPPQKLVDAKVVLPRTAGGAPNLVPENVILQALVNEKGVVEQVRVVHGFSVKRLGIDEACEDALKQYRYKPATKDGVRVKTWLTISFKIDLTRGR
ncbi:MAG TPA: energy transducer TonB, partial [Solirubrobacteraceae bacterium]|nr:energy transducer TonB [Solirubrobacteraceae bacterium]